MNTEILVEKLISVVEGADRITTKNTSLPILQTILLIVSGKVLKVRATNLSIGVQFEVAVKSESDGVVAVDGKTISAFLSTLPKNAKVTLVQNETTLTLSSGKSVTTIKTYPYEDFPTLPAVTGDEGMLPAKEFLRGIKSTYFAAALSDIKPEIASVQLVSEKDTLYFVATDSFRLAEKKEILKKEITIPQILLPYKNIVEIARIFEGVSDEIAFVVSENQISFSVPGVYITSRLVAGSFPDYKQIIPKAFSTEVVILKQDLVNSLKAANVFSDKFNQITLAIYPSKKKIECTASNTDVGEYTGGLEAALSGDDVVISINQRYLLDALTVIPQDSVVLGLNGSNKALVVRGVSDTSFTYLLMPMNRS
jgi:DNA polymerase-3 subunit beta